MLWKLRTLDLLAQMAHFQGLHVPQPQVYTLQSGLCD